MNQFVLKGGCKELLPFKHIAEVGYKKNSNIKLQSLSVQQSNYLRFYYINEGKFEWQIDDNCYSLYPGDFAIILPHQMFGGDKHVLNIGALSWLLLDLGAEDGQHLAKQEWVNLPVNDAKAVHRTLFDNQAPVISNTKFASTFFLQLEQELLNQEIGYTTRINQLLNDLLILTARQLSRQNNLRQNFPQSFLSVEQALRKNLSHQWTVEEMAALIGLGNTAFSEKVKSYTGFSPLNYLINIRISEAVKLLKRNDVHVTDIALQVGFYSSQHFATTFKKLTGYTPREFRKNNSTTS